MAAAGEKKKAAPSSKDSESSKVSKMHRRSRSGMICCNRYFFVRTSTDILGCFTCRLRRKKCDEGKSKCKACRNLGLDCEYKRPIWWSNNETRRKQKDHIKTIIKKTKTNEKNSSSTSSQCMLTHPLLELDAHYIPSCLNPWWHELLR
jgi:hypothetical protein